MGWAVGMGDILGLVDDSAVGEGVGMGDILGLTDDSTVGKGVGPLVKLITMVHFASKFTLSARRLLNVLMVFCNALLGFCMTWHGCMQAGS